MSSTQHMKRFAILAFAWMSAWEISAAEEVCGLSPAEIGIGWTNGYAERWTVFWLTAHFLNAAAEFREMGVSPDSDRIPTNYCGRGRRLRIDRRDVVI